MVNHCDLCREVRTPGCVLIEVGERKSQREFWVPKIASRDAATALISKLADSTFLPSITHFIIYG